MEQQETDPLIELGPVHVDVRSDQPAALLWQDIRITTPDRDPPWMIVTIATKLGSPLETPASGNSPALLELVKHRLRQVPERASGTAPASD